MWGLGSFLGLWGFIRGFGVVEFGVFVVGFWAGFQVFGACMVTSSTAVLAPVFSHRKRFKGLGFALRS